MNKPLVIIGLLGTKLDRVSSRRDRWAQWRPTVAACQQPDLVIDRFELLHDAPNVALAKQLQGDIESVSPETRVRLHPIAMEDPWDFESVYATLHGFASRYPFDTEREDYLVHITTGSHVSQICLFLLTESRHLPAALLQTSPTGRTRGHSDPAGMHRIIDLDLSRYDHLAARFQVEHRESQSFLKAGIETCNEPFNRLIERIERVTLATSAPMLLSGPTGAGKTALAKRIYQLRRQRELVGGELVEINCATIRGDQAMSTLFGHKKGAFTGASSDRGGLLAAADGGVLFLDEIGELGLDEQAMLLRAIEEKEFLPVGSDRHERSDFQLIAGTHRDLVTEVRGGRFREDLLARINLWSFRLPGLADRRDDIDPNLDYELQRFAESAGRKVTLNKEARRRFLQFAAEPSATWRGNFRDLNAAVTRMATLAEGGRIDVALVEEEIERLRASWGADADWGAGASAAVLPGGTFSENASLESAELQASRAAADRQLIRRLLSGEDFESLDRFDRVQLAEVLRVCQQSRSMSEAGRMLYQASRLAKQRPNDADRLRKYLLKFGLRWDDVAAWD